MLALPFFAKRFGIKRYYYLVLLPLRSATAFVYGGAGITSLNNTISSGILLHGVSYDFYYVTAYIYVDKSVVHMRTAAQGLSPSAVREFGSLLGYRLGGVMMEKCLLIATG